MVNCEREDGDFLSGYDLFMTKKLVKGGFFYVITIVCKSRE